jgi:hypothetical protein
MRGKFSLSFWDDGEEQKPKCFLLKKTKLPLSFIGLMMSLLPILDGEIVKDKIDQ